MDIDAIVREKHIRFFDLKYSDLSGRLRHVTMPIEGLEKVISHGVGFDSSSVAGFGSVEFGDMALIPDLLSAFVDPFAKEPTLSCFAEIHETGTGHGYDRDPRAILKRAVGALLSATGADEVMILPEFEFYLFNKVEFRTDSASSSYRIFTDELRHDDPTGLALFKGPAYHVAPPFDRSSDFRSELCGLMAGCGIPVKYHHHEGGRYSQVEVEPDFLPALRAADGIMLTKYLTRNLALKHGMTVTFMPKPIFGEAGSGMHFHQYLVRSGASLFGDEAGEARLSTLARYYIGGLIEHAPSLCAITNPSTNSYRRLVPGYEAPVLVFYSQANRTAAIRIPGYVPSAAAMEFEYRIPDATCNPYLALAAMLLAGLDGIRRKLDPGPPVKGRLDSLDENTGRQAVPLSLVQALAALKQDNEYLLEGNVFPADLVPKWIEMKTGEAEGLARRPHPWEFSLYYGC